jgi:membrane-associated protein
MLASILTFTQTAGYPLLFGLIMAESAGVPLPGETALITAGALAGRGKLSIALVIAVAAGAAIIGDNLGYLLARRYGRGLLQRPGPFLSHRRRVLEFGEPFFARHGPKAVFFARWILGLRTWTAWLAGASGMDWRPFAIWNAAGGISWAATVGLAAYFIGQSTTGAFTVFGLVGLGAALLVAGILLARNHRMRPSPRKRTESNNPDLSRTTHTRASAPSTPRTATESLSTFTGDTRGRGAAQTEATPSRSR